jgi:hypothetical protein
LEKPAKIIQGIGPNGGLTFAEFSTPEFSVGQSIWVCTIHCPALFTADKSVAGIDADQALELAEMLVTELFDHRGIKPI